MNNKKTIIKNILSSFIYQAITIVYGFIVPVMIIKKFGSEVNGLISSIAQFLAYISLLEGGIGPVIKNALYKPLVEKNKEEVGNILGKANLFFKRISYVLLAYISFLCVIYPRFINNNYSVELLEQTYNDLNQILDNVINQNITTASLLKLLSKSAHFVRYDVEIIMKERNDKYYKTVYLRESAINAMNMIGSKIDEIKFTTVIGKDYWLNVQEEVAKACLNGLSLDSLIERMLKIREGDKVNKSYVSKIIRDLIEFDFFMKGDIKMDKETKYEVSKEDIEKARKCAFLVAKTLPENKVNAYRQKLISALVFHDYDRVCEILLQLSGFSGISMPFAYKLYENPEENKSIAFSFANGLEKNSFADKQFKGGI